MKAAETRASRATADWTPLTVVSRSLTTAEIETFMSDVSMTKTNIAIARRMPSRGVPVSDDIAGEYPAWTHLKPSEKFDAARGAAGVLDAVPKFGWMKQEPPHGPLARVMSRRVRKKGFTPRVAASFIAGLWALGVVVFGVLERLVDPDSFDNVWLGMWWALQTVTTVGYGDLVPSGTAGKLIAAFLMLGGLSLFAVVTGAVTSIFVAQAQAERQVSPRIR